jgi:hypothetical protein
MHRRRRGDIEAPGPGTAGGNASFEVHAAAAAFIYALLKNGLLDEAGEFQEWYLETFDYDLES